MTLFRMEVKQNCEIFLKVDERSVRQEYFLPWKACPHPKTDRYPLTSDCLFSELISILSISSSYRARPPPLPFDAFILGF
ncbi:hypothetical protein [Pseudomonas phage BL2]|nr:hypothetical protein [Pseudomonas phage BL2]